MAHPLFVLPLPESSIARPASPRKRKRSRGYHDEAADSAEDAHKLSSSQGAVPEYSAVLTPQERVQRRLAGLELDKSPPPYPFPHASHNSDHDSDTQPKTTASHDFKPLPTKQNAFVGLRSQHIAAMTAVLHRCMLAKDYARATRALSLLLRTSVNGDLIDIRNGGLWRIAAELLLRDRGKQSTVTREGFLLAKKYYLDMVTLFPPHKSWAGATNAHDFYIAMFGLWVFVVTFERRKIPQDSIDVSHDEAPAGYDSLSAAKAWELTEAEEIAKQLDEVMLRQPYSDNIELQRLRAMVALWLADLLDATADDVNHHDPTQLTNKDSFDDLFFAKHSQAPENMQRKARADAARIFARKTLSRLEQPQNRESDSDRDD